MLTVLAAACNIFIPRSIRLSTTYYLSTYLHPAILPACHSSCLLPAPTVCPACLGPSSPRFPRDRRSPFPPGHASRPRQLNALPEYRAPVELRIHLRNLVCRLTFLPVTALARYLCPYDSSNRDIPQRLLFCAIRLDYLVTGPGIEGEASSGVSTYSILYDGMYAYSPYPLSPLLSRFCPWSLRRTGLLPGIGLGPLVANLHICYICYISASDRNLTKAHCTR